MSTMYIACNNSIARGYFLGDMLGIIKVAWLFVRNEPHERYLLSLHEEEPLNFLWDRFIRVNRVQVVHDRWAKGDRDFQYQTFDRRLSQWQLNGIPFDTYKELYARVDGGSRQGFLCGSERGLAGRNIFEYYYFGQQARLSEPAETTQFGRGVIDVLPARCSGAREVFIAPHEKCEGNRVFTHAFWAQVIERLLAAGVGVSVNDPDLGFMRGFKHPAFRRVFPEFSGLVALVRNQTLVVCGNTGVGWVAGACETPLIAAENSLIFVEYSFEKCGFRSLRGLISEPCPETAAKRVLDELEKLT